MEISRLDANTLAITRLDPFLVELLRQIPLCADPSGSEAATERIFTRPSDDEELCEEWKEYVQPELRHIFEGASATVTGDLAHLKQKSDGSHHMSLRDSHVDAWLNCLNQARLVVAARNKFTEEDMDQEFGVVISSQREFDLFRIHFYGLIQESLLRLMAGR